MTNREILASTILPNTALGYIFQSLIMFEGIGSGLTWENIKVTVSPDDKMCIADIMLMLVFDTILYLLIAVYIETAFPRNSGYHPPWYFPILVRIAHQFSYLFVEFSRYFNRKHMIMNVNMLCYSHRSGSKKKPAPNKSLKNPAYKSNRSVRVSLPGSTSSTSYQLTCTRIK